MTKDWVHAVRAMITSSPSAWTICAGMLSTPVDFPFFNECTATSNPLRRMGWSSSASVWEQFNTDGSPPALWLSAQSSILSIGSIFLVLLLDMSLNDLGQ